MANQTEHTQELRKKAEMLLQSTPLIDGHNDLPWQYRTRVNGVVSAIDLASPQPELHTDIPKLKKGLLGGQFWSVYVATNLDQSKYVSATMEQIDLVYDLIDRYRDTLQLALNAEEVSSAFSQRKIASLIGMEGGHCIGNSLGTLRMFYKLGARYLTLTHNRNVGWADSCTDRPESNGLSDFGRDVVREMNRLGMLVDLSHVAPSTMHDALDCSVAPLIFSHSSAKALVNHPRNVPDEVLRRIPVNNGVVMVSFVPSFTSEEVYNHTLARESERERLDALQVMEPNQKETHMNTWDDAYAPPQATLEQVADHIDHVRTVAGINHIGIGSDFDGIRSVPVGLEDVSTYPALISELIRRGYSDDDIRKILGENILRVMRDVEKIARRFG